MSRTIWVPDFGDSGALYQPVPVAEPGEPGYPTPELPDGDPWAPAVNQAIREIRAQAWAQAEAEYAEYLEWLGGPEPEAQ